MKDNFTIVTGFWDIKRNEWKNYNRYENYYYDSAWKMLSLNNNMIVFIDPEDVEFVKKHRSQFSEEQTTIIPLSFSELPYHHLKNDIIEIMNSDEYKNGLVDPTVPEVCVPDYDVVIWSKIALMKKAIELNPYGTTYWAWIDFGIGGHTHMFKPEYYHTKFLNGIIEKEKIRMLCRHLPEQKDLIIEEFYKAHRNRLLCPLMTGSAESFLKFQDYVDEEIQIAIAAKLVDCEQSFYAVVYLKHPELFDLFYGDYEHAVVNY